MTGVPPDTPRYTEADLIKSWQVGRAFGFAEGVRAHSAAVDWMVAQAVQGPHHWDGRTAFPDLDEVAHRTVLGLYRRYLLLTHGGLDVRTPPRPRPAPHPPGGLARGHRRDRAEDRAEHGG